MFIDVLKAEFNITPKSILHIGANQGQEVELYDRFGIKGVHIEADPKTFEILAAKCTGFSSQTPVQALVDREAGRDAEFNIATNAAQSSSLLDLGRHAVTHPNIKYSSSITIKTTTVDTLYAEKTIPEDIDFVVIDVQGAEGRVLEGAANFFENSRIIGIYIEASLDELYSGGIIFSDLNDLLQAKGFYLNNVKFTNAGWGNALYLQRWWRTNPNEVIPIRRLTSKT